MLSLFKINLFGTIEKET